MKKYQVGLIGCGSIAGNYIRYAKQCYSDYFEITMVADIVLERAKARAEKFEIARYGTPEEIARIDEAENWLKATYGDKIVVYRAGARVLNVHAAGVSKIQAARELQKRLGRKILVCIGDAENDLPMLEGADYAFCPSDGVVADRFHKVCPCADGAVADVIYNRIPEI